MAVWHHGFLGKCHQIAVALRVSYGGRHNLNSGGGMAVMAEDTFFFLKFLQHRLGRVGVTRPNTLTRFSHENGMSNASTNSNMRTPVRPAAPRELQRDDDMSDDGDGKLQCDDSTSTTHQRRRRPAPARHASEHHAQDERTATATATVCDSNVVLFFFLVFFLFDTLFYFWFCFFFSVQPSSKWLKIVKVLYFVDSCM